MSMPRSALRVPFLLALLLVLISAPRSVPVAACVPPAPPRPGATQPAPTATPTINTAAAESEVVFRGHPISQEDISYKLIDMPTIRTTFAVETAWKGVTTPQVSVLTYSCVGNPNPFADAGTYIIYASKGLNNELVSYLGLSRRAGTNDMEDAILGPGTAVAARTVAVTPTAAPLPTPVIAPTATPTVSAASGGNGYAPLLLAGGGGLVGGGLLVALLMRRRMQGR